MKNHSASAARSHTHTHTDQKVPLWSAPEVMKNVNTRSRVSAFEKLVVAAICSSAGFELLQILCQLFARRRKKEEPLYIRRRKIDMRLVQRASEKFGLISRSGLYIREYLITSARYSGLFRRVEFLGAVN